MVHIFVTRSNVVHAIVRGDLLWPGNRVHMHSVTEGRVSFLCVGKKESARRVTTVSQYSKSGEWGRRRRKAKRGNLEERKRMGWVRHRKRETTGQLTRSQSLYLLLCAAAPGQGPASDSWYFSFPRLLFKRHFVLPAFVSTSCRVVLLCPVTLCMLALLLGPLFYSSSFSLCSVFRVVRCMMKCLHRQ